MTTSEAMRFSAVGHCVLHQTGGSQERPQTHVQTHYSHGDGKSRWGMKSIYGSEDYIYRPTQRVHT